MPWNWCGCYLSISRLKPPCPIPFIFFIHEALSVNLSIYGNQSTKFLSVCLCLSRRDRFNDINLVIDEAQLVTSNSTIRFITSLSSARAKHQAFQTSSFQGWARIFSSEVRLCRSQWKQSLTLAGYSIQSRPLSFLNTTFCARRTLMHSLRSMAEIPFQQRQSKGPILNGASVSTCMYYDSK